MLTIFFAGGFSALIAVLAFILSTNCRRNSVDTNDFEGIYRLEFLSWAAALFAITTLIQALAIAFPVGYPKPLDVEQGLKLPLIVATLVIVHYRMKNLGYSRRWLLFLFIWFVFFLAVNGLVLVVSGQPVVKTEIGRILFAIAGFPMTLFWIFLFFAPANFRMDRKFDRALSVGCGLGVFWFAIAAFSAGKGDLSPIGPGGLASRLVEISRKWFQHPPITAEKRPD
jgi:hypothetical protein